MNLILVCITIRDKLIKHLYNSHLRKLPITHREVSVMSKTEEFVHMFQGRTMNLKCLFI